MSMMVIGSHFLYQDKRWRCLMYDVYWLAGWLLLWGSKYWEYYSSIRTKNTLNIGMIEHKWSYRTNQTKAGQKWMKIKQLMNKKRKLATNLNKHWTYKNEGWIMTIQYLQGLNIFVIMELTFAILFARVLAMRHQISCSRFLCFSTGGSLVASWKSIEAPSSFVASYLTFHCSTSRVP